MCKTTENSIQLRLLCQILFADMELPRATNTSALSSAGVMRLFNKVGETVNKITYKMDENDMVKSLLHYDKLILQCTVKRCIGLQKMVASFVYLQFINKSTKLIKIIKYCGCMLH